MIKLLVRAGPSLKETSAAVDRAAVALHLPLLNGANLVAVVPTELCAGGNISTIQSEQNAIGHLITVLLCTLYSTYWIDCKENTPYMQNVLVAMYSTTERVVGFGMAMAYSPDHFSLIAQTPLVCIYTVEACLALVAFVRG